MPKQFIYGLFLIILIATGCATGSHVITGTVHPETGSENVRIYAVMPEKADVIGIVSSDCPRYKAGAVDDVMARLKREAAKIGANGIVLTSTKNSFWSGTDASGTAIFVP